MAMGRNPANPLALIKESWVGNQPLPSSVKSVNDYLTELQAKLTAIHDYADVHARVKQQKYVDHYNKRAVDKRFQVGQQVIVLLHDSSNKLQQRWQGPGTVVAVKSPHSNLIELEQGQRRWFHANKLRSYYQKVNEVMVSNCAIVYDSDEDFGTLPVAETVQNVSCVNNPLPSASVDPTKLSDMNSEEKQLFLSLLDQFPDVFDDEPGLCTVGEHAINVTPDFKPKRLKAYKVPELLKPEVARQLQ